MMEPAHHHKYDSVGQLDEHDEARSSTEVDESLMGDEKGAAWGPRPSSSRRARCARAFRAWRWAVDTALLVVILGLLVRDHWRTTEGAANSGQVWPQLEIGGDMTGVRSQPFGQKLTRFTSDQSYAPMNTSEFFTNATLDKWNALMPKGMGFVWVNETHRYHDLPTPIDWPDKTVFTTSVTHTLHCLFAIVQTYSGLTSGHPIPDDHHWHMIHCFDYMRNTIMCNADIALEGHETTFPDDNGGSDGWDSTHVCKDYSEVKAYLESVRAYDDQLIY